MASQTFRVVVIGGGVIGCAILYEFARRGVDGLLVEAEPDICEGTSKANSARERLRPRLAAADRTVEREAWRRFVATASDL